MAGTREKGKIPHGEWAKILARYRGGETIARIGRDYGCTPPAIRYIIKRSGGVLKGTIVDERRTSPVEQLRRGRRHAQFAVV